MQKSRTLMLFEKICRKTPLCAKFVSIAEFATMGAPNKFPLMLLIVSICELNVDWTKCSGNNKYQAEKAITKPKKRKIKPIP